MVEGLKKKMQAAVAIGAATVLSPWVQADWVGPTSGTASYLDPANWADLNGDTVGDVNDKFGASYFTDAATLNLSDNWTTSASGLTFGTYTPTLDINLQSDAGGAENARTLTLNGRLTFHTSSSSRTLNIGGATNQTILDLNGGVREFAYWSPSVGRAIDVFNPIQNGSIVKLGNGQLRLRAGGTGITSMVTRGGEIFLDNAVDALSFAVRPTQAYDAVPQFAGLVLRVTGGAQDRIANTAKIQLFGAYLNATVNHEAYVYFTNDSTTTSSETVGTLALQATGRNGIIRVGRSSTAMGDITVTLTKLERNNGSLAVVRPQLATGGEELGLATNGHAFLKFGNGLADLRGGTGAGWGAQIIPYLIGNTDFSGVVTYTEANGVRALSNAEYVEANGSTNLTTTTGDKAHLKITAANNTLSTGTKTIQSLTANNHLTLGSGATLLIASGVVNANLTGSTVSLSGGTLDFNEQEAIFVARSAMDVSSRISNAQNVTFTQAVRNTNFVVSNTANSWTGTTTLTAYGAYRFIGGGSIPDASVVRLHPWADFYIGGLSSGTVVSNEVIAGLTGGLNDGSDLEGGAMIRMGNTAATSTTLTIGGTTAVTDVNKGVSLNGGFIAPGFDEGGNDTRLGRLIFGKSSSGAAAQLRLMSGTLKVDVGGKGSDFISVDGNVTFASNAPLVLEISALDDFTPVYGQSWTIMTATGSMLNLNTGSLFTTVNDNVANLEFTASIVGNSLVISTPEPAVTGLIGMVGASLLSRRRAKRVK